MKLIIEPAYEGQIPVKDLSVRMNNRSPLLHDFNPLSSLAHIEDFLMQGLPTAVVEFRYDAEITGIFGQRDIRSIYILVNKRSRIFDVCYQLKKNTPNSDASVAKLAADNYFDAFRIPVAHRRVGANYWFSDTKKNIEIDIPDFRTPLFAPSHVESIARRVREAGYVFYDLNTLTRLVRSIDSDPVNNFATVFDELGPDRYDCRDKTTE